MALLTRDSILTAQDIQTVDVDCPEWGGTVRIKAPTGAERDEFETQITKRNGKKVVTDLRNIRARTVAKFAVDEGMTLLFSAADMVALGEKSGAALDRCFTAWMKLAGMSEEEMEEVAENLDGGQSAGGTSA